MMPPECCGPTDLPGKRLEVGQLRQGEVDLHAGALRLDAGHLGAVLVVQASFGVSFSSVVLGSGLASTASASISSPFSSDHARRPSAPVEDLRDRRLEADLAAMGAQRAGQRPGDRAHPAFDDRPAAEPPPRSAATW